MKAQIIRLDGWEIATRAPAAPIRRHVGCYNGYRERCRGPSARREVSGTKITFILDLGPPILVRTSDGEGRYASGFVAGLHDRYAETVHHGYQEGVQLDLSPIGARLLFGMPMRELAGRVVGLDVVSPHDRDLVDEVREQATWDARFDVLDRALLRRFDALSVPGRVVAWAVAHLHRSGGDADIAQLAHELGYSTKQVARLFHEWVGVGPKHYARLVRFERLLRAAEKDLSRPWAELALDFGYYDQAHLTREVRALTGLTPTELRAERADVAFIQDTRPVGP